MVSHILKELTREEVFKVFHSNIHNKLNEINIWATRLADDMVETDGIT